MEKIFMILWIALAIILIGWVLKLIYDKIFGIKTTIEPVDPQELLDSEFEKRDDGLNELVNMIYSAFNVKPDEVTTKSYQSELGCMIVKLAFFDMLFTIAADWSKKTYTIGVTTLNRVDVGSMDIYEQTKKFKMNPQTYLINYKKLSKFLNGLVIEEDFEDILQNIADIVRAAPELEKLPEDKRFEMLFEVAVSMSNLLKIKKFAKNRDFSMAYTRLMFFICASGKRLDMINFLKELNAVTPVVNDTQEPIQNEEIKEEE